MVSSKRWKGGVDRRLDKGAPQFVPLVHQCLKRFRIEFGVGAKAPNLDEDWYQASQDLHECQTGLESGCPVAVSKERETDISIYLLAERPRSKRPPGPPSP